MRAVLTNFSLFYRNIPSTACLSMQFCFTYIEFNRRQVFFVNSSICFMSSVDRPVNRSIKIRIPVDRLNRYHGALLRPGTCVNIELIGEYR